MSEITNPQLARISNNSGLPSTPPRKPQDLRTRVLAGIHSPYGDKVKNFSNLSETSWCTADAETLVDDLLTDDFKTESTASISLQRQTEPMTPDRAEEILAAANTGPGVSEQVSPIIPSPTVARMSSPRKEQPSLQVDSNPTSQPPAWKNRAHKPSSNWAEQCTAVVLKILKSSPDLRAKNACGWEALKQIWNITVNDLDSSVLTCLRKRTPLQQEHILLSFASIDLSYVVNLSAYLNSLIKEHESTRQVFPSNEGYCPQVCLYFLAGVCTEYPCQYVHPVDTVGWNLLKERWNLSYQDLDYTVLNYLSKKNLQQQDEILTDLANANLNTVNNLSAYLSSVIQKYEHGTGQRGTGKGPVAAGRGAMAQGGKQVDRYSKGRGRGAAQSQQPQQSYPYYDEAAYDQSGMYSGYSMDGNYGYDPNSGVYPNAAAYYQGQQDMSRTNFNPMAVPWQPPPYNSYAPHSNIAFNPSAPPWRPNQ